MKQIISALLLGAMSASTGLADSFGTLNPDEMTWQRMLERADDGETGMVICSMGYALTKSGTMPLPGGCSAIARMTATRGP